jgi:hypothetical protein
MFRLLFYFLKLFAPLFFAVAIVGFATDLLPIKEILTGMLVGAGLFGAVLGILMAFGWLRMRCPFCGRRSPVWGTKQAGLLLSCDDCGLVSAGGLFGMTLTRERKGSPKRESGPKL